MDRPSVPSALLTRWGSSGSSLLRGADGRILLDNCPFHAIAVDRPELVCGLNLAFIEGLLKGGGVATARADGVLVRIRRVQYGLPHAPSPDRTARELRGLLTCLSAAPG